MIGNCNFDSRSGDQNLILVRLNCSYKYLKSRTIFLKVLLLTPTWDIFFPLVLFLFPLVWEVTKLVDSSDATASPHFRVAAKAVLNLLEPTASH